MAQHFFIDGYNLLFCLQSIDSSTSKWLEKQRNQLIYSLKTISQYYTFSATLFFDGRYSSNQELARSKIGSIEVLFTPTKQTVDQLLLGTATTLKNLSTAQNTILVTSDRALASAMRSQVDQIMSSEEFIFLIRAKSKKASKRARHQKERTACELSPYQLSQSTIEEWVRLFSEP